MTPLPQQRLYLPFEAGPYRMAMGLVARPPEELIEIDDQYPAEMAERRHLLATNHPEVFATCPGSEPARAETLALLVDLLTRTHPDWFTRQGRTLHNRLTTETWDIENPTIDPLELAGRLVQEDLCLIDPTGETPLLAAAILCAPSRWRLTDKIGRPLAVVHAPVPLYQDRLANPVDRFMRNLRPGRLAERLNWSIVDDPALFQQSGKHRTTVDDTITPENAPDRLYLRVERQTLAALPTSAAVLFAIHVHSYPVARILTVPGAPERLAAAIQALPESFATYKSLPAFQQALLMALSPREGVG